MQRRQGISAFTVLSVHAPITLAAIFIGAWLGLKLLIEGYQWREDIIRQLERLKTAHALTENTIRSLKGNAKC